MTRWRRFPWRRRRLGASGWPYFISARRLVAISDLRNWRGTLRFFSPAVSGVRRPNPWRSFVRTHASPHRDETSEQARLIVDAVAGIVKADIGIKGNRIVGIGKAGNPDVMAGVTPGMVTGVTTIRKFITT